MSTLGTPRRNKLFYYETIVIQVEDELFRVPRYGFQEHSEVFENIFTLPGASKEGTCDEQPLILSADYPKAHFESLLKLMYWRDIPHPAELNLSQKDWIGVLNISTRLQMQKIRKLAIQRIYSNFVLSSVDKVLLGREYRVADWLIDGYSEMVQDRLLPLEAFTRLGTDAAMRVLWLRTSDMGLNTPPEPPVYRDKTLRSRTPPSPRRPYRQRVLTPEPTRSFEGMDSLPPSPGATHPRITEKVRNQVKIAFEEELKDMA
ncbi:hypothetical protein FA15DRAFT_669879 [Coprinopsis marcescibilis]|uniref:BTB domain-containing protein n=1 Tax=Coprinopsis marcescibilis TaxID=230819 RepID=A0A5C3KU23_COPMA|nr:hypothetical protein FA15DRAFT_669879 [Coprinopsis marcescibilis]